MLTLDTSELLNPILISKNLWLKAMQEMADFSYTVIFFPIGQFSH
jgi:hypothetical protein